MTGLPSPCPVCGAYSVFEPDRTSTLLAVCDELCVKTLETLGKYVVRAERSRHNALAGRPFYLAHTIWPPDPHTVDRVLRDAWVVVPPLIDAHGACCDVTARQVVDVLDTYIKDLAITGTAHNLGELAYRFEAYLDLPVHLLDEDSYETEQSPLAAQG